MTLKELMQLAYNAGRQVHASGSRPFNDWWEEDGRERHDAFTAQLDEPLDVLIYKLEEDDQ